MSSILSGGDSYLQPQDGPEEDGISHYDPRDLIASWIMSDPEQVGGVVRDEGNNPTTIWSKRPSKKKIFMVGTMAVMLGVVAVVVGIVSVISSNKGDSNNSSGPPPVILLPPTPPPTVTPSSSPLDPEQKRLVQFLSDASYDLGAALDDKTSPQFQAANWLFANEHLQDYSNERKLQRYALATLYYSTGGDLWLDKSGWLSDDDECEWRFGKWGDGPCGTSGRVLVDMQLTANQLSGTIPPEIGLLSDSLVYLDLGNNYLSGTIPAEMAGSLTHLKLLNLQQNAVSGPLPSEIGRMANLSELLLDDNRLSGSLPESLWNLSEMQQLVLGKNQFKGTLATEIGLLTNLTMLTVNDNKLKGTVPTELGLLSSIEKLDLTNNPFSGSFPNSVCEIGLEEIGLTCETIFCSCCTDSCLQEYLAGSSPDNGESLLNLTSPQYQAMKWLENDSNLEEYDSVQILQRYALATLYYSTNGEDWDDELDYLDYDKHVCVWGLEGPSRLPIEAAWASSVDDSLRAEFAIDNKDNTRWSSSDSDNEWIAVDLGEPYVLDSIRIEWEAASAKTYKIQVSNTKSDWVTIVTETNGSGGTETMDLKGRSGRYVRMLGTKRNTDWGYSIYEITIRGASELDLCDQDFFLKQIALSDNGLSGSLPPELALLADSLEQIILPKNSLSGPIPSEIGLLTTLTALDLSSNNLTSSVPPEMGSMSSLESLLLDDNGLEQAVPIEFESLTNLEILILDENDLTGSVPVGVCNLTTLTDLRVDCLEVDCGCCEVCTGRLNDGN